MTELADGSPGDFYYQTDSEPVIGCVSISFDEIESKKTLNSEEKKTVPGWSD